MKFSYLPVKDGFPGMAVAVKASAREMHDDLTPMMQISAFLDQWVQVNFRTTGYNVGGWEPYKYGGRLVAKRRATGKSHGHWIDASAQLERKSGALRASFLPFYSVGVAGIGSDLPYAQYQSEGTRTLPDRRMLPHNEEVKPDVSRIFNNWVARRAQ